MMRSGVLCMSADKGLFCCMIAPSLGTVHG